MKLNKLFLALAGISAVSAGLAVGVVGKSIISMEQTKAATTTIASSSLTKRVWTRPNFSGWYDAEAQTAIRAWGGSAGSETLYETSSIYNSLNTLYYWFADIPLDVSGYQAVRLNPADGTIWSYSQNFNPNNSTEIAFINSYDSNSYGVIDSPNMSANLAAKMVEGYTTCLNSAVNGFQAGNNIRNNIYSRMSSEQQSIFATTNIIDYSFDEYDANQATDKYSGLTKNISTTAGDKYNRIIALYDSSHPSGAAKIGNENDSSTVVLGGAAVVALFAAAGYFFVRKRKAD